MHLAAEIHVAADTSQCKTTVNQHNWSCEITAMQQCLVSQTKVRFEHEPT